jgi:hypothetical protein
MRHSLLTPAAAVVAALALGCGEQPSPAEPADASHASFRTEQNPDGPGAFATHVPEGFFIAGDANLSAVVGISFADLVQLCAGELPFPPDGFLDRFLVFRPDGSIKSWVKGRSVPIVVWQTSAFDDICAEGLLAFPHLEGTGQFHDKDNDLLGSGNRGNAFGPHFVGQVTSEAGDRFHFLGQFHVVVLRSGEVRVDRFELSLRPIGG